MSESTRQWIKKIREQYKFNAGNVLDIGSLNVNGSVREFFSDAYGYLGIDFRDGKDVDMVMNAHEMIDVFDQGQFDTVICLDMLEHDDKFWLTLEGINHVLKEGGYLLIVQPTFNFPLHRHPKDYWRVGEDVFNDVYFENYEIISLDTVYTKYSDGVGLNSVLCGIGKKL